MAFADYKTRRLHCKIVYFGARGVGKTANLRSILTQTTAEIQQGITELAPKEYEDQAFFEFLPLSMGSFHDHHLKVHLYTLPIQNLYSTCCSVMLKGIDGMIFVADSAMHRLKDNLTAWQATQDLLGQEGIMISDLPAVMQYNKRDHPDAMPVDILRSELNSLSWQDVEANAQNDQGVMLSLSLVVEGFMEQLRKSR